MSFYDQMQGVAAGLLSQFDQGGLVLSVCTPGAGPAYAPGPSTFADHAIQGVVSGVDAKLLTNTLIQSTDLQVTFAGGGFVPKMIDRIKIAGESHEIVAIIAKPATGVVAAYTVVVRK